MTEEKIRKLKGVWSYDAEQDLRQNIGDNISLQGLAKGITLEIPPYPWQYIKGEELDHVSSDYGVSDIYRFRFANICCVTGVFCIGKEKWITFVVDNEGKPTFTLDSFEVDKFDLNYDLGTLYIEWKDWKDQPISPIIVNYEFEFAKASRQKVEEYSAGTRLTAGVRAQRME